MLQGEHAVLGRTNTCLSVKPTNPTVFITIYGQALLNSDHCNV